MQWLCGVERQLLLLLQLGHIVPAGLYRLGYIAVAILLASFASGLAAR